MLSFNYKKGMFKITERIGNSSSFERKDLEYVELIKPTDDQIKRFSEFYNQFARKLNIKKCDVRKLQSIRENGTLIISYITNKANEILCSHAHFCNGYQTFGMYSALKSYRNKDSNNGQLIGTANKYLDWINSKGFLMPLRQLKSNK